MEPRFLFSFSAHKAHCSFAPIAAAMDEFCEELKNHSTTKCLLKIPYSESMPEDLIRRIGEFCLRTVGEREDDSFW